MATKYPEKIIFSINMLAAKNADYITKIQNILGGVMPTDMDYEKHLVQSEFGNKVIKVSIVSPDVALIARNNVKDLADRVRENNVAMLDMISTLPLFDMTQEEIEDMITRLDIEIVQ